MDFMRLLKSLEELLYELVSWLVFYPLTFWRALTRPLSMMRYADLELDDQIDEQYEDTVSPPLFLLITLLLSQALSGAFPVDPAFVPNEALTASTANLLIVRGVIFGIVPMAMAVTLLRVREIQITRRTLRPPFFSQCYVAAPFAFLVGLTVDLLRMPAERGVMLGLLTLAAAICWYGQAQIRWFREDLGIGTIRAIGLFLLAFVLATLCSLVMAVAIGTQLPQWNNG